MKYKVNFSEDALEQLQEIYDYILYSLKSPESAASVLGKLKKAALSLDENPERFQKLEGKYWKGYALRRFPVGNYLIIYYVDNDEMEVGISAVVNGRRNLDYLF